MVECDRIIIRQSSFPHIRRSNVVEFVEFEHSNTFDISNMYFVIRKTNIRSHSFVSVRAYCNERMYVQKWCNWCRFWYGRTRLMWSLWVRSKALKVITLSGFHFTLSGFHYTLMNYLAWECCKTLKFQFCSELWLIWKKPIGVGI